MIYAQFYHLSTGYVAGSIPPKFGKPELIEACGDRACIVIDARLRAESQHAIAKRECSARGFFAYKLYRGETFTRSVPITELCERG